MIAQDSKTKPTPDYALEERWEPMIEAERSFVFTGGTYTYDAPHDSALVDRGESALTAAFPENSAKPIREDRLSASVTHGLDALDSLTGVYHRRYLEEKLPEAILYCRQHGQSLSLIYADIDRFTWINECYGRVAGDLVLQHVAQTLQKRSRRPESWVARDHADALAICLPDMKNSVARRLAGNLRVAIMSERLPLKGDEIAATCSFIVQTVEREGDCPSAEELLHQAREQVALAKKAGGNMVLSCTPVYKEKRS